MTTVATGNPYGDQSGIAPDFDAQKFKIQSAYDSAIQKFQAQREGTLQQYGFTSSGGLNDILGGGNADVSFNPQYQNSIYGKAMQTHGRTLQDLRKQTAMRGIGDVGLGAQAENEYQGMARNENEGIKQNLLGELTGNLTGARDAQMGLNQGLADTESQRSNYNAWGNTHNVSEGGNVADPSDYAVTIGNLGNAFRSAAPNLRDKVQAGAYLGRIRDMILGRGETPGILELAGTEGYNAAQVKQTVAQYQNYLRQAGLNPNDAKWALGNGLDPVIKAAPKAAPKKKAAKPKPQGGSQAGGAHGYKRPGK